MGKTNNHTPGVVEIERLRRLHKETEDHKDSLQKQWSDGAMWEALGTAIYWHDVAADLLKALDALVDKIEHYDHSLWEHPTMVAAYQASKKAKA